MDEPPDLETRVTALEGRIEEVASDAAAARHLAAARDRDYADFAVKIDANRSAINALGLQLGGRITAVENRLDGVENRLGGVENRLDGVENRLGGVENRLTGVENRVDGVENRLGGVENRLGGVENRLDGVENRLDGVEVRLGGLEQQVGAGFAEVGVAFAEVRGRLDATAAGQQTIVALLTRLIDTPESG